MSETPLAIVAATGPRRWFGISTLAVLGALLVYLAFSTTPSLSWQLFLLVVGAAALWLAEKTRRATENHIILTAEGIFSSAGEEIATLDNVEAVKRGTFDLKPSNGFTVILKERRTRRWQPGLWWTLGRHVGIGGVTPGSQSKVMAQMLEGMLAGQMPDLD